MRGAQIIYPALILAIITVGCGGSRRRVFFVVGADAERELAAQACVKVTKTLGAEKAAALLDGHIIRRGDRLVIAIREWDDGADLPSRRVTITADSQAQIDTNLPSGEIVVTATRASADGRTVRNITVKNGFIKIRRAGVGFEIALELNFNETDEPTIQLKEAPPEMDLYRLDAAAGRALPTASPEDYLKPF